ncbi:cleavage stimulating factor 64-like [Triticum dicoccoides]|uniref:cleavage stimulating factor 64-like n=1 Tax=Triticum dicoccoides TaxID=85692 RepID=UPI00189105B2|nr:cleavage stimulating factor 64-like [Triticum dicoccoides]
MDGITATSCRCSSVVFVGNIPYKASEMELWDVCEEIGPVASLRVAADKDTGRPRGFAFCEYFDDETARSACRNLHGHPLHGRALRVGIAAPEQQQGRRRVGDDDPNLPVGVEGATHAASQVSGTPSAAVTRYLAGMSRRQLRELLDAVAMEPAESVERAKREFRGLATLIEQAGILLDMATASDAGAAGKRPGGAPPKVRKLDDGTAVGWTVPRVIVCR